MIRTVVSGTPRAMLAAGPNDGYLGKLVKYVPVEGLAPFIPIAALAQGRAQLVVAFGVSLAIGLALIGAQAAQDKTTKTRLWYWPFVVVSFAAWSVGASADFRELLGVSDQSAAFFLGLTSAAIPALDSALESIAAWLAARRRQRRRALVPG